jgi:hypothetical protein
MFGAPDAPGNVRLVADSGRGHSRSEIKIEWDAVDETEAYYAVFRYSETDSSLQRLAERTEDTTWTDSQGLRAGVYYYYKVQAIVDDIASGRALRSQFSSPDPEGFILSPPAEVVAEKVSNGSITVKWRPAKGNENERSSYRYNVYAGNSQDTTTYKVASDVNPAPGADGFISAEELNLDNGSFFRVTTVNANNLESSQSIVVSPSPAAAVLVETSRYAFIAPNERANSNGIYPVKITWRKPADEDPAFYHIQRSTRRGTGYSRINEAALPANGSTDVFYYDAIEGVYTYIDRNEMARVGRKYYYRVLSLNQLEQGSFPSNEGEGWGALTHNQYLIEFNKTMASALKKLTYMHKPGSTDKLGTETKNGTISGTIYYNAAISGLGARIIIQLTNYADFYIENEPENGVYFVLNGNSNTSANMSSNGTMDGTLTCTGMYPGSVSYDRIEIKGGAAGGGTYGVQPAGYPREEVPYTVIN